MADMTLPPSIPLYPPASRLKRVCILLASFLLCLTFVQSASGSGSATALLTPAEQLWLKDNQSRIVLAVETGYPPFVFLDARGKPAGLAHEYLRAIESKLGVRFRQQQFSSLDVILAKARSGEVQIVNAVTKTPQRSTYLSFSEPFISLPNVILVRKERTGKMVEKDLAGLHVSLVKSYAITEHLTKSGPGMKIDLAPDDLAAILSVSFGRSDAAVIDLATASYLISSKGITNLRVAGEVSAGINLSLATPLSEAPLRDILQKGLDAISPDERDAIQRHWIHAEQDTIFTRRIWIVLTVGLIALTGLVAGVFFWNWSLRRLITVRTNDLAQEKKALQLSEERYRTIVQSQTSFVNRYLPGGVLTFVNEPLARFAGLPVESLTGTSFYSFIHPDDRDEVRRRIESVSRENPAVATDCRIMFPDGTFRWTHWRQTGIFNEQGELLEYQSAGWDVTDQKKAEEALLQSRQRMDFYVNNSPMATIEWDSNFNVTLWAGEAEKIFGWTAAETTGKPIMDLHLIYEEDIPIAQKTMEQLTAGLMKYVVATNRNNTKDGRIITCEWYNTILTDAQGHMVSVLSQVLDITERIKSEEERLNLQQQLLHAQKLESLGVLAGGVAHDFNNILTSIIGNTELAMMQLSPESPIMDHLRDIEKSSTRAADLARQMLAYSGKGRFVIETIDLNHLLEEMVQMLNISISRKALLRLNLHRPLPAMEADATQIRQVVMNLVINASEALAEMNGTITITTGCLEIGGSQPKGEWQQERLSAGQYVFLEIVDTGCGMSPETIAKIFDPFFTTKFTGRGLGMAAVQGIVRGHKGAIKVCSEVGQGTAFKVVFPASDRQANLLSQESVGDPWEGKGKVLLIDDEEGVLTIGKALLKKLGFIPVTARNGRDGIEVFRQNPDILCVILDLTMPVMDGEQCFRALKQLRPDVKVIMSSGYSEQEVVEKFTGTGLAGFAQKPYKFGALRETLKTALKE